MSAAIVLDATDDAHAVICLAHPLMWREQQGRHVADGELGTYTLAPRSRDRYCAQMHDLEPVGPAVDILDKPVALADAKAACQAHEDTGVAAGLSNLVLRALMERCRDSITLRPIHVVCAHELSRRLNS
jgi:hypothetical protein